jgi:hypothetical protein
MFFLQCFGYYFLTLAILFVLGMQCKMIATIFKWGWDFINYPNEVK